SLFPEVEETKLLYSSNLLKGIYNSGDNEKRIIDTNELIERRIEAYLSGEKAFEENGGEGVSEGFTELNPPESITPMEIINRAKEEASSIIEKANEDAGKIIEDAHKKGDEDYQDAINRGFEEGLKRGRLKAEKEAEILRKELEDYKKNLDSTYDHLIEELEPKFVDKITRIYEHIFNVDLSSKQDILYYLITMTMRNIDGSRNFIIHVSREDYPFVFEHSRIMQDTVAAQNATVEIVEDQFLEKGSCMIETENGMFDCGIDTQLEELGRRLRVLAFGGE
ncbi:MAG: hypothetical protein K6F84_06815, partial [Lachnospiraceae bacterium]|nr:hypothetical protein [Lachnospiraceae bacterium]